MIYIIAPTNFSSGGPELLHQLAYILKNKFKKNVKMYYFPITKTNPVHKEFRKYRLDYVTKIIDDKKNTLVVPEVYSNIKLAAQYNKINKILWWLSVDNYLNSRFRNKNNKLIRFIIKLPYYLVFIFNKIVGYKYGIYTLKDYLFNYYQLLSFKNDNLLNQFKFHLCQSFYAINFLKKKIKNKNIFLLQDFQKDIFLKESKKFKIIIKNKKNIITYNATKANDFMNKILKKNKNIKFIPLKNLTPEKMLSYLKASKIYMDFGFHPGKDRAPREATLLGNCIISNFKGSANFHRDVGISRMYKFKEKKENLLKISNLIKDIFYNYEENLFNFQKYRKSILLERVIFLKQLKKISKIFN